MGTTEEVLFTVEEAAQFMNVSQATVYRLLRKGILEKRKIPGKRAWRITLLSCEAYRIATNMTVPELARKVVELERKVDFLLTQGNSTTAKSETVSKPGYNELREHMQKHHPEYFS